MPNQFIYAISDEGYDHSRWLNLSSAEGTNVCVELADLCMPGRVSGINHVFLPLDVLKGILLNGVVQVTKERGYVLLRRVDNALQIEFRGLDDLATCRASVKVDDCMNRLAALGTSGSACAR